MSFIAGMNDKTIEKNKGSVVHRGNERQNDREKQEKCRSSRE
ncbi:hypothetical protein [Metabacillus litoralis]|nr:hypothetical protein [Metabacillus litoralis]